MKRGVIAAAIVIVVLLVAQAARQRGFPLATVTKGEIAQQLVARARVEPAGGRLVVVQTTAVKRVISVAVHEGDVVTEGQLLATVELAPEPRLAQLAAVSPTAKRDDGTTIKAARAGTILQLNMVRDGGYAAGAPLAVIADLGKLQLQVEVEERHALRVKEGQEIELFVPGATQRLLSSKLTRLGRQLGPRRIGAHDARVRAEGAVRTAYATLSEAQSKNLLLGQELEARIALPAKVVDSMLPRSAVTITDGQAQVLVPGVLFASARRVTLGVSDETHVEVGDIAATTSVLRDANQP